MFGGAGYRSGYLWHVKQALYCHVGGPGSIPGRCSMVFKNFERKCLEVPGIDPGTSGMLSKRSTATWAARVRFPDDAVWFLKILRENVWRCRVSIPVPLAC